MNNIQRISSTNVVLVELAEETAQYISASKAQNTTRAYRSDWRHFENWCRVCGLRSLPTTAAVLTSYITAFAGSHRTSTLSRWITAIREAHKAAGFEPAFSDDPVFRATWEGIKRIHGTSQRGKEPLVTEDLRRIVAILPASNIGIRDRAILLLGFAGAFRRSELVGLDLSDLKFSQNGVEIVIRRSKTDQTGHGLTKAIPFGSTPLLCPVRALMAWMECLSREDGPLFVSVARGGGISHNRLSDRAIANTVKHRAAEAGLCPEHISGHSLRVGFATQAAINGASDRAIMAQTGHRSRAMVDRYVRKATIWQDTAAARLGL